MTVFTPMLPNETQGPFAESVNQDQTAQNLQSDLDLHSSIRRSFPSRGLGLSSRLNLYSTIPSLTDTEKDGLKNILGKGENAVDQMFSFLSDINSIICFAITCILPSEIGLNLDQSKI